MPLDVRTITDDEVPAWCAAVNTGFLNASGDVDAELRRPSLILDRTWGGLDGATFVATLRSFPSELTVPGGGVIAASAMTAVTTTSTHRRRGLASRLVAADLASSLERGEMASVLIAAEGEIYGRFGYGPSTEHQTLTVDTLAARLRSRPEGTVGLCRPGHRPCADAGDLRATAGRASRTAVSDRALLGHRLRDPGLSELAHTRSPRSPSLPGTRRERRSVSARYEYEQKWAFRRPLGEVTVRLFLTAGPLAESLLWHHLISLDLTVSVKADNRPADELLPWLLTDARHAQASERSDFLWLRPLDVARMLAARRYQISGTLVLEVVDTAGLSNGSLRTRWWAGRCQLRADRCVGRTHARGRRARVGLSRRPRRADTRRRRAHRRARAGRSGPRRRHVPLADRAVVQHLVLNVLTNQRFVIERQGVRKAQTAYSGSPRCRGGVRCSMTGSVQPPARRK